MPVVIGEGFALTAIACLLVALGLTVAVVYVVKGFFGVTGTVLGKLPVVGGWIDASAHHIEQRITNALGQVVIKLEAGIGAVWHFQARVVDWLGREIARHANLISLIATLLNPLQAISTIQRAIHEARYLLHRLVARIEGIGHDLGKRVGHVERGIGEDVLPRIRGLEREINGEIVRERVRARSAERTAEREITNLWKWARHHTLQAGTLAFAGAVALALSRLGLGWLRCNSLSRLGKRVGCGGFAALEDILFGAVTALAVTDLCEFATIAMGTAELIRPALLELVDVEDALVGCHGATGAPPLEPSRLRLPTNTRNLPLAA